MQKTFLVPDRALVRDDTLRAHRRLDEEAGVEAGVACIGAGLPALARMAPAGLEFGLWDDAVCCTTLYGPDGAGGRLEGWRLSADDSDLGRARQALHLIDSGAEPADGADAAPAEPVRPEEPVALSALLADRIAQRHCRAPSAEGAGCAWYHGVWQYLRVLDLVTAPTDHGDFFCDNFRSLAAAGGHERVLVSGQADYSTLAHALWAYRKAGVMPDVTVLDICETPLRLGHWYADRVSAAIRTRRADILDFDGEGAFDVVCTHSFLGNFPFGTRRALMDSWRRALRPGGKVVTINRIRPPGTPNVVRFTADQAAAFRDRARDAAADWRDILGIEPDDMADRVMTYARSKVTYPVRSRDEIVALFEENGFAIERLDSGPVSGRAASGPAGPTAPGNAQYARIVAVRR